MVVDVVGGVLFGAIGGVLGVPSAAYRTCIRMSMRAGSREVEGDGGRPPHLRRPLEVDFWGFKCCASFGISWNKSCPFLARNEDEREV